MMVFLQILDFSNIPTFCFYTFFGMTAAEYVTKVVAEAIEDACDYERCAAIIDEYERNPVSFSHDEVMREFGLR